MAKNFSDTEKRIIDSFYDASFFSLKGKCYQVELVGKPLVSTGECKTDVFIQGRNDEDETIQLKISVKQRNADFLENKINKKRAIEILGIDALEIIRRSTTQIKHRFLDTPLVFPQKVARTEKGSITLGWKFELLNKGGGGKSAELDLSEEEKLEVIAGHKLPANKRNASINGQLIYESGVATHVLEVDADEDFEVNQLIERLIPIEEYVKNLKIYFACKALNYRLFNDKWDGDRPLAVTVDWKIDNGQLVGRLEFDSPFERNGNECAHDLKALLGELNLRPENFDEVNEIVMTRYAQE